jgi:hypothetical protein
MRALEKQQDGDQGGESQASGRSRGEGADRGERSRGEYHRGEPKWEKGLAGDPGNRHALQMANHVVEFPFQ